MELTLLCIPEFMGCLSCIFMFSYDVHNKDILIINLKLLVNIKYHIYIDTILIKLSFMSRLCVDDGLRIYEYRDRWSVFIDQITDPTAHSFTLPISLSYKPESIKTDKVK